MMVLGFLAGLLFEVRFLQGLIIPFTFLMIYPMMVVLKIKKVIEGGDAKAQVLTQVINFAVIPFVAYEIGAIFFSGKPFMALGLLLASLVPTSGMTISWTGFAKGNGPIPRRPALYLFAARGSLWDKLRYQHGCREDAPSSR